MAPCSFLGRAGRAGAFSFVVFVCTFRKGRTRVFKFMALVAFLLLFNSFLRRRFDFSSSCKFGYLGINMWHTMH